MCIWVELCILIFHKAIDARIMRNLHQTSRRMQFNWCCPRGAQWYAARKRPRTYTSTSDLSMPCISHQSSKYMLIVQDYPASDNSRAARTGSTPFFILINHYLARDRTGSTWWSLRPLCVCDIWTIEVIPVGQLLFVFVDEVERDMFLLVVTRRMPWVDHDGFDNRPSLPKFLPPEDGLYSFSALLLLVGFGLT